MQLSSRKPSHPYGRCFRTAYLCKMGGAGFFPGMYSAMRAIFKQYQSQLPRAPYPPFDAGKDVLKVGAAPNLPRMCRGAHVRICRA